LFPAAADVEHIAGNLDYNTLQENIHNVAFCNIESELVIYSIFPAPSYQPVRYTCIDFETCSALMYTVSNLTFAELTSDI
jgi:hypothetical protein